MITDPNDNDTVEMNFNEHKENTQINVGEFEALCKEVFELKAKEDVLENQMKELGAEIDSRKKKIMGILDSMGKEKHFVGGMGTLFIQNRFTVSMPKEPTQKKAFYDYLREKGIFEDLVTVHSQTLNAYYKNELAAAAEVGNVDFKIPGLAEPNLVKTLAVRKS